MFKNYLIVTIRGLQRNLGYTLINLTGLAVGIACFVILALYLESELTYDQHYDQHKNIYRVTAELETNGKVDLTAITSREIGPLLKKDYPEVNDYVRFFPASFVGRLILRYEELSFYWDDIWLADENVFEIFSHEIIAGDPKTALRDPLSIALSESMAKAYFGDTNPIGKSLRTDTGAYKVTLVFADLPENTHFKYNALLSYNRLKAFLGPDVNIPQELWNISDFTYLLMEDNYDVGDFNSLSTAFYERYMKEIGKQRNSSFKFYLQPIAEIHLDSTLLYDEPTGNKFYIYAFAAIALFVLIVACINYMNLATARSIRRAKEIGMRKVLGARKRQLVGQFLGESLMFAFVSLFLATLLVHIVLNYTSISNLLGKHLVFSLIERPALLIPLMGLGIVVGLVSGLYPAFYLSGIKPIAALRGDSRTGAGNGGYLRKTLVLLQFTISVSVIACTILMAIQMHYVQSKPLGFDKENLLLITLRGADIIEKAPFIKGDLEINSRILDVAGSENIPGEIIGLNLVEVDNDLGVMEGQTFNRIGVDSDFFELMGIELIAGRNFGADTPSESSIIVNETAVKKMGWRDPLGKRIHSGPFKNKVIGVVKDFHFHSLHHPVEPLFIHMATSDFSDFDRLNKAIMVQTLMIKVSEEDVAGTIRFLENKWREYDPKHPFEYRFLSDVLDQLYDSEQRQMQMIGIFAGICILISCLGLFGLASFTTAQRTKEIGIRKILGATPGRIILMLFRDIVGLILIASIVASAISYWVIANWLVGFEYKQDINLFVFLLATTLAIAIAFATVALQSYKTVQENPGKSLRYEG